ncbi:GAF domain-containing protein [Bradyrhizobium japonicum]|uniref:GAF domain-containing protein n=1 Tax=Bradyrhizobium japonicum TaxID=375 RepID=UPI00209E3734|nr:GAF domain-containing protein [Bradyrhizobium japonicum]MCP1767766.1 signal transduction histidine kinase [Bradyrhizobium japonicum]MCP1789908.1 signal transduction histidine kinase [Bradyrhizobium japonicum]MCP1802404.1 signal transduction histidine kinase [Bradyrhizobium japonicum]MCP1820715.1 signal transduction histidine kinase [Bradyrhizobium japonicum]MCP1867778.1 signal transduction histidine kinase [Bradyrhizobium japonicum]
MTAPPQDKAAELERQLRSQAAENARLQAELAIARDRQNASMEILRTIANSSGDAEGSLQQIAEATMHLFGAPSATIHIAEGDGWSRVIRVGDSSMRVGAGVPLAQLKIGGRNMPGTIVAENRQVHVPDLDNVDPAIADWPAMPHVRAAGTRSMSGSPLRLEGKAIGALIVYRDRLAPFTDDEMALQQSFADQAAIAIENARLFNETRESLERQTATADILKVLASSPSDVQPVFDAIAANANRLIGGFSTAVLRYVDGAAHLVAFTPGDPAGDRVLQASFPVPFAQFPAYQLVAHGESAQLPDTELEPAARDIARARGFRSMLFTPLMSEGEAKGVIIATRRTTGAFAEHHVRLLQTFADQAVIAVKNVSLFNATREALERQTATADILKVIAASPADVTPVFQAISDSAKALVGGHSSTVTRVINGMLHLAAFTTDNEAGNAELRSSFPAPLAASGIHSRVATSGEYAFRSDMQNEPDLTEAMRELARTRGYRSILVIPMLRDGIAIGTIGVTRPEAGPFPDKAISLLKTFADQAVIAVENTRLFNEVQDRTRELARSLDDLRAAQDRLVQTEKLASLGQLTAGIAHEIKNPLNFVNNFASLSAELTDELNEVLAPVPLAADLRAEVDELTGLLRDNLGKVVQHGRRADSIVKNMLLHSREGGGEHRLSDINALVEESLNLAYHGARAEKPLFDVTLKSELDPAAGSAEVFPQEISRVLLNLISNGFYAVTRRQMGSGAGYVPVVIATTRDRGDSIEIRIRDNGTGIPEDVKAKMFNPFFTTKPAGEGTGLGLSMSHDIIVKQHGGTIDVTTEPGVFTEFTILLPRKSSFPDPAGG